MDKNGEGNTTMSWEWIYSFLDGILEVFSELESVRNQFSSHLNTDVVLLWTKFIQVIDDTQRMISEFEREVSRPVSSSYPHH